MKFFSKMKLSNLILLSGLIPIFLMSLLSALSISVINDLEETRTWVEHTEEVINKSYLISKLMIEAESGQKGFLVTGDEEFLAPYYTARDELYVEMSALQSLVQDNPSQVDRIKNIKLLMDSWFREAGEPTIGIKKQASKSNQLDSTVIEMVRSKKGKKIRDDARALIKEFTATEHDLLKERRQKAESAANRTNLILLVVSLFVIFAVLLFSLFNAKKISSPIASAVSVSEKISKYDFSDISEFGGFFEATNLYESLEKMRKSLDSETTNLKNEKWLKTNVAQLMETLPGVKNLGELGERFNSLFVPMVGGQIANLYIKKEEPEPSFYLSGSYGADNQTKMPRSFKTGEGLIGQAAKDKTVLSLSNLPVDFHKINSSLGRTAPKNLLIAPILLENNSVAVFEVGKLEEFTYLEKELLKQVAQSISVVIANVQSQEKTSDFLRKSEQLNQRLKEQQDELQVINEELQQKQEEIETQSEDLQRSNEELHQQSAALEGEKERLDIMNRELESAKIQLEEKAQEATRASQYKSEFLANMSHELRTPLNSIMILSQLLSQNEGKNLTQTQVRNAGAIYSSGADLLKLINDILDLSKIEAGKLDVNVSEVALADISQNILRTFDVMMKDKHLQFVVSLSPQCPAKIWTDQVRLEQILKNLLSNAHKFTEKGRVEVIIEPDPHKREHLAISVIDTGIGIPKNKQEEVFEAFRQVDSSVSRKYQGTGLGLSISKSLAEKLQGDIAIESKEGVGSKFRLSIPVKMNARHEERTHSFPQSQNPQPLPMVTMGASLVRQSAIVDDRKDLRGNDKIILVIEDDPKFAQILLDQARKSQFKCIYAENGELGLSDAQQFTPHGIILDVRLPGMSGMMVLDQLKNDLKTRHIPVHVVTVEDFYTEALRLGAIGYGKKPISLKEIDAIFKNLERYAKRENRSILLIEDSPKEVDAITQLIGSDSVFIETASFPEFKEKVASDKVFVRTLIDDLTVPVTSMFRDPEFYKALRVQVIPFLKTFPRVKVWVAGCATGEEAFSLALLFHEEGLYEKTLIYATDISSRSLHLAKKGIVQASALKEAAEDYMTSGGTSTLDSYFLIEHEHGLLQKSLMKNLVFSEHSLSTDNSFGEMQLILCRNVIIYFNPELQDRAFKLFLESLCRGGFLCLGSKESLGLSFVRHHLENVDIKNRIFKMKPLELSSF